MLINIRDLSVVQPHECEPGSLLIGGAHYSDPPAYIFALGEALHWFEFAGTQAFNGFAMANNLHPHLRAGPSTLLVDVDNLISPTRSDIPTGSVVLIGEEACFAIRINHGTAYVTLGGQVMADPQSYDRLVAFPRWQLVVPAFGDDEWQIVHDAGAEEDGG